MYSVDFSRSNMGLGSLHVPYLGGGLVQLLVSGHVYDAVVAQTTCGLELLFSETRCPGSDTIFGGTYA